MKIINTTQATVNDHYELPADTNVGHQFVAGPGRFKDKFVCVNDKQALSFESVIRRQGREAYIDAHYDHLDGFLAVQFKHIFIGIEPDGYAHS